MRLTAHPVRNFGFVLAFALIAQTLSAQTPAGQTGAGTGAGAGAGGTTGGTGTGTTPGGANTPGRGTQPSSPFPDRQQQQQQPFPNEMARPVFLSGKVVLDDGTPPPEPVVIEMVCNGQPRPQTYTTTKGHFSFQVGQNQAMMADASVGNNNDPFGSSSGGLGMPRSGGPGGRGISERDLMGCELRAAYPGFRSESVNLAGRRSMDNGDVGTIILRRMGNVEGLTLSATSAAAPKDAKKAFEKGRELARKKKPAEAQKEFEKAVQVYPKYANAWADLGLIYEMQNQPEEARKAYGESIKADSKLVKPYVQLSLLAASRRDWKECADTSERAIKLNPFDYPQAFFYNSVANYNLQNMDAAEKSARDGLKTDGGKKIAKLHQILGIVLAQKNDVSGAMEHMKGYLSMLPSDSTEIPTVKGQILQLEKFAQNAKPAEAAQQQQQP